MSAVAGFDRRPGSFIAIAVLAVTPALAGCSGKSKAEAACNKHPYSSSARVRVFIGHAEPKPAGANTDNLIDTVALSHSLLRGLPTSRELMQRVIAHLNLNVTPEQLTSLITATAKDQGGKKGILISLSVKESDPATAHSIAKATSEDLTDYVKELATDPVKATVVEPASYNAHKINCTP